MINISDFGDASWFRTATAAPARAADVKDASSWFEVDALHAGASISGDVSLAARGLSVEQHAARVLAHLCGDDASL